MAGVHAVATELARDGLIVAVTARNAPEADILATSVRTGRNYAVQVKTNGKRAGFWLMGSTKLKRQGSGYVYVFVNLPGRFDRPEFFVVPTRVVFDQCARTRKKWRSFYRAGNERFRRESGLLEQAGPK